MDVSVDVEIWMIASSLVAGEFGRPQSTAVLLVVSERARKEEARALAEAGAVQQSSRASTSAPLHLCTSAPSSAALHLLCAFL